MDIPTESQLNEEFRASADKNKDAAQRQKEDLGRYAAFLEEEEKARKVLWRDDVLQGGR